MNAVILTLLVAIAYFGAKIFVALVTRTPKAQLDLAGVQELVDILMASRLMCTRCVIGRRTAQFNHVPEDELPVVNVAQIMIEGEGLCTDHI